MKLRVINTHDELLAAIEDGVVLGDMHFPSTAQGRYVERVRKEGFQAGKEESERRWAEERANLVNAAIDLNSPEIEGGVRAQERERILGIQSMTENGFENVARQAIIDGVNMEQFAVLQLREMRDRGITLDNIRRDAPPAAPHCAPPKFEGTALKRPNSSDAVFERRKQEAKSLLSPSR